MVSAATAVLAYPQPQDQPDLADSPYPMVYPPYLSNNQRRRVVDVEDVEHEAQDRSHHGYHPKGRVGPVYTFVKTDYHGNVKWGVRHVAGKQYGRR